ncbi:hypothetical protein ATZ36_02925 [Candidatus Endomicrobiellum trichonymphae]|uniref:Uncharacterized protein n=1 Tax=Endomicrobium trichonymphae TaxID=1408204 RepID=A0A1E5IKR3_ENDTX|nr:hypothetical protein ATZ36_02925 [Candidatus Endomicrobium trichonymphae]
MKRLVLFAMLAAVFGLSFVSCSGGSKSESTSAEKNNAENAQQGEVADNSSTENAQETDDLSK